MSYLKNATILFVILLLSTPTNGHGPSRQKVSESIEINATSDEVLKEAGSRIEDACGRLN